MLGGDRKKDIENAVKSIYRSAPASSARASPPDRCRHREGPTLDEIHAEEARSAAELKAKKAALLAEAMAEEGDDDADDADDAEAEEASTDEAPVEEEAPVEAEAEEGS